MRLYIDASFLLAIITDEPDATRCAGVWDSCEDRYSSQLLWAECIVTLRRLGVYEERSALAEAMLGGITALAYNDTIVQRIKREAALSRCRTLDAIHIASALELNDHAGDFAIASLDERMRGVASSVSLPLHPELEKI